MIAIFGAFGQEIVDLRRRMVVEEVVATPACKVYRGKLHNKDAVLVRTGMGKERAENATRFVLERYPVTAIISLGFAGALAPNLRVGDVVVCSKLHCVHSFEDEEERLEPHAADAGLHSLALQCPEDRVARFLAGSGVTALQLDPDPEKMQELRDAFDAHIIDMESYWIARMASARQIPFIAIRSISDTVERSVQPFDRILAPDGSLLWKKAVLCFLLHPRYLMNVFALFRNTRPAKKNMAAFVSHLVTRI